VSVAEHDLLATLARDRRCIIEVGVFEAATSQVFCREMNPGGILYLVDPFFPEVRLERWLDVSFTHWVANKTMKPFSSHVLFIRKPSVRAAEILPLCDKADLIFIDARHDYDSVLEDFRCWAPMLAAQAVMAFHDSRVCAARPDMHDDVGPVRLMREIAEGKHGPWEIVGSADTVTVIRRRAESGTRTEPLFQRG